MTYPNGSPGWYPTQSPAAYGGYGAYWPQLTGAAHQRSSRANQLVWVVLILGLATYLVSYGAVPQLSGTAWGVRFSTLAAVVAALGLLPRQSAHTKLMAALAVMGFFEALCQLITGEQNSNWTITVIVVVNALQALTAIAALLAQPRVPGAADHRRAAYDAYAYYAQAAQQYAAPNNQQGQQQPVQVSETAQAEAAAAVQAQQSAAERDALYAEYFNTQQSGPNPAASPRQSGERTPTAPPASGTGIPTSGPAESIGPGNHPATRPATQSSPW
jgi:hypothetical protein